MTRNYLDAGAMMCRTAEEIEVLRAISQVSARMARNLFVLATHRQTKKGVSKHDKCRSYGTNY